MEDKIRDLAFEGIPRAQIAVICSVSIEHVEKILANKQKYVPYVPIKKDKPVLEMIDDMMKTALCDMQHALAIRELHPSEYAEIINSLADAKVKYLGDNGNKITMVNPTAFIETMVD